MVRDMAILGAAVLALQVACQHAEGAPVTEAQVHHAYHKASASLQPATLHPAILHPATLHTLAAHKKIVRRQVAHAFAEPEPEAAAVQVPTPEVDTADGTPTPLAFHVGPAIVAAGSDSDESAKPAHKRSEAAAEEPAFEIPVLPSTPPVLSDQESAAGEMANAHGDKTFLMVDKALGKIILFENGQPVFAGPALTGESTADQMPKTELKANFDTLNAADTKITPAGRYTVERGFDPEVGGPLFDIDEIRGKDWGIAIHQLYLGIPSEHRDARILSPSDEDKHITFGCINVQTATLHLLMHELPVKGPIPLYILPEDASQTAAYFTPHTSS
jgi:hypothetical protein